MRGALPDDLGFYCGVPGHLIFPPGQPRKLTCPGPGTNGLAGVSGGGEVCRSSRLSQDYTRKNSNAIRHRSDRDRDWRKGWRRRMGELLKTENIIIKERGGTKLKVFFFPMTVVNAFKIGEA